MKSALGHEESDGNLVWGSWGRLEWKMTLIKTEDSEGANHTFIWGRKNI